jgi:hypothetical protein
VRIVWIGHLYPPAGAAGAEWTAHEFLLACARAGHDASYWRLAAPRPYTYEGIPVLDRAPRGHVDAVIGHLGHAQALAQVRARRRYWMAHAAAQVPGVPLDGVIANSLHVQDQYPGSHLLRPHVPDWRYEGPRSGQSVTLINLNKEKGGDLLPQLMRLLPDVSFLGVRGAYGQQAYRRGIHGNLTVWDTQPDINVAHRATRILLMPSVESWGRVAVEAAWRQVPTIARPSIGALEAGVTQAYATSAEAYAQWIRDWLGDPAAYRRAGERALRQAKRLQLASVRDTTSLIKYLEAG